MAFVFFSCALMALRILLFFDMPISNFLLDGLSPVDIVHFMFSLAHPGCVILDIQPDAR